MIYLEGKMALLIPSFNQCSRRMTPGERRLAQRLDDALEDDYLVWYDVPIGPKQRHPDFLILHPSRGLVVLEVKDWKLNSIEAISPATVTLAPDRKQVNNPLRQARDYALEVNTLLQRDPKLVHPPGSPYAGKLVFPYGYGVVLTHISRREFEATDLGEFLEPRLVLCKDEFTASTDPLDLQQYLWNLPHYAFGQPLTPTQIDRIRWHIFPELRINPEQMAVLLDPCDLETELEPTLEPDPIEPDHDPSQYRHRFDGDLLRVMDLQQEQLARSLGQGHRVIHGVAGSGKTLILAFRCQHLTPGVAKPILVLCFNVALSAKLRHLIQAHPRQVPSSQSPSTQVIIRHFHGWCSDQIREYGLGRLDPQLRGEDYIQALVQRVIEATDQGEIPAGRYSAVLVDEGHDFEPAWLKLIAQQVDPGTNALLLLYDDAQNLYGKSKKRAFSFKSLGIQAQGRTTILKVNYRNTAEVLQLAYEFARTALPNPSLFDEDAPILIQPETAGRHGPLPELIHLPTLAAEAEYIGQRAEQLMDRGIPWQNMAIVYRSPFMGQTIRRQLLQMQIPVEWINENSHSRFYQPAHPSIKLVTMHSSKGLEFPVVFLPGVGFLPYQSRPIEQEARLFYVAMTRAIDRLILTYDRSSLFVERIQTALQGLAQVIPEA